MAIDSERGREIAAQLEADRARRVKEAEEWARTDEIVARARASAQTMAAHRAIGPRLEPRVSTGGKVAHVKEDPELAAKLAERRARADGVAAPAPAPASAPELTPEQRMAEIKAKTITVVAGLRGVIDPVQTRVFGAYKYEHEKLCEYFVMNMPGKSAEEVIKTMADKKDEIKSVLQSICKHYTGHVELTEANRKDLDRLMPVSLAAAAAVAAPSPAPGSSRSGPAMASRS